MATLFLLLAIGQSKIGDMAMILAMDISFMTRQPLATQSIIGLVQESLCSIIEFSSGGINIATLDAGQHFL